MKDVLLIKLSFPTKKPSFFFFFCPFLLFSFLYLFLLYCSLVVGFFYFSLFFAHLTFFLIGGCLENCA